MTKHLTGSVVLTHDVGLHARPSVKLTKLAKTFGARIMLGLSADGPWIDAKSINKVMGAKIAKDTVLFFEVEGDDAPAALDALTELVERDFEDEKPVPSAT